MAEEMKAPDDLFPAVLEGLPGFHAKLFPMEALKNARPPFFFYAQTREEEDGALDGLTGLRHNSYNLHAVGRTFDELQRLCRAARSALLALTGTETGGLLIESLVVRQVSPDLEEREVGYYRRMYELQVDWQLTEI